jgi:hypothetical protein
VNLILNSGLVQKQAAAWDTWVLGTATANSSGSTATVKLDGDSTAVTLPTSVPCFTNDRVVTGKIGQCRLVALNLTTLMMPATAGAMGAFINGLTAKATPAADDQMALMDSAASNVAKKLSWSALKTALSLPATAWTAWTPTVASSMGLASVVKDFAYAYLSPGFYHYAGYCTFTTSGTASSDVTFTLPVAPAGRHVGSCRVYHSTGNSYGGLAWVSSGSTVTVRRYDKGNWPVAAGQGFEVQGIVAV